MIDLSLSIITVLLILVILFLTLDMLHGYRMLRTILFYRLKAPSSPGLHLLAESIVKSTSHFMTFVKSPQKLYCLHEEPATVALD